MGSRESAKFYRGYEKGMQILGPQLVAAQQKDPEGFDLADFLLRDEVRIDRSEGEPKLMTFQVSDWWRDEVEFKPVDSPLPLDIVEQRDQYFAGAYPYLAKVLPTVEAQPLITRRERMPQLELAAMLETIRRQYGIAFSRPARPITATLGPSGQRSSGRSTTRPLLRLASFWLTTTEPGYGAAPHVHAVPRSVPYARPTRPPARQCAHARSLPTFPALSGPHARHHARRGALCISEPFRCLRALMNGAAWCRMH